MTYSALYQEVQDFNGRIKTAWLRDRAIALSSINRIKEQWTSVLEKTVIRGFYIEGPLAGPVQLQEHEALIVLARSLGLGPEWRRLIFTKELMHVFDTPEEKTDSAAKLDTLVERFGNPSAETSVQFKAELKAYWRALGVLCPEALRLHYKAQLEAGGVSIDVVAAALSLPPNHARNLFRNDFSDILKPLKGN